MTPKGPPIYELPVDMECNALDYFALNSWFVFTVEAINKQRGPAGQMKLEVKQLDLSI